MYSTTIQSDGQLRQMRSPSVTPGTPVAPKASAPPKPAPRPSLLGLPGDKLLILAIILLLLQNKKPDYLLLAALAYILL